METPKRRINILILEDDLSTLCKIFNVLRSLRFDFSITVLSRYDYVEKLINKSDLKFDLILLDRDCSIGGSFHVLDLERFGAKRTISISSVPPYNIDALRRGVSMIIHKNYEDLNGFSKQLAVFIKKILNKAYPEEGQGGICERKTID